MVEIIVIRIIITCCTRENTQTRTLVWGCSYFSSQLATGQFSPFPSLTLPCVWVFGFVPPRPPKLTLTVHECHQLQKLLVQPFSTSFVQQSNDKVNQFKIPENCILSTRHEHIFSHSIFSLLSTYKRHVFRLQVIFQLFSYFFFCFSAFLLKKT